jgi:hypothetical protein
MTSLSQTIAIPIWAVFVAIAAVVVLAALIRGLEIKRQLAVAGGIVALLAAVAGAITSSQHGATIPQSRVVSAAVPVSPEAERRALEARRSELTARAATPGSPLGCLDALAGVSVERDCEQAIFASPTSAAVAVSYATARLQLLADGIAFARRADPSYESSLSGLRLAAQNDAYGIYAHILATRDGCTSERCDAFALVGDPSTLKVHLRQRLYANYLAQHRDGWGQPSAGPVTVPTAASTATMALAASELAVSSAAAVPLPKARPAPADGPGSDALAAVPMPAETPSATVEKRSASIDAPPVRSRGPVPPVASVVPNLDYPSSSSIPPISIMAAEPKLPPASSPPAKPSPKPSTARQPSSRPQ